MVSKPERSKSILKLETFKANVCHRVNSAKGTQRCVKLGIELSLSQREIH